MPAPLGLQVRRSSIQRPSRRLLRQRPPRRVPGGGFVGSVTFPTTRLTVRVLVALGADPTASPATWVWEDITAYIRYNPGINLEVGKPDEQSTVVPGRMTLHLDNRDARFTRRNPTSPYYGLLSMNTPIWVTVDPGSGVVTRAEMFVNSWPNRWPDKSGNDCIVTIECSGVLRRLGQTSLVQSPLRRSILAANPVAYWPMEDGTDTAIGGNALNNGAALQVRGTVDFATAAGPAGSLPLPSSLLNLAGELAGAPPPTVTTSWGISFVASFPPDNYPTAAVVGAIATWTVPGHSLFVKFRLETLFGEGFGFSLVGVDSAGTDFTVLGSGDSSAITRDTFHHLMIWSEQSGSNIVSTMYFDGALVNTDTRAGTNGTTGIGMVTISPIAEEIATGYTAANVSLGHWATYDDTIADVAVDVAVDEAAAMNGYAGDMAHVRMRRVCAQENIPFRCVASTSVAMGAQSTDTVLNVLREGETADQGMLYETGWGLGYLSIAERYNSPLSLTLDFDSGHIAEIPEPADDDQRVRNRWTASRLNGSEATIEQTSGFMGTGALGPGDYSDSKTVNVETDTQLPNQAGWRVHLGTVDEDRWPRLDINLTRNPSLVTAWTTLPWGSRVNATNPPAEVAPDTIDAIIEGYAEHIAPILWTATVVTAPYSPYRVVEVGSSVDNNARVDSADSQLLTAVDTTTTSLTVDGTLPWSTSESGYSIGLGGEQMSVSSVASYAADAFGRTEVNGWGTGDSGGVWFTNGGVAGDFSVASGTGRHAPSAVASTRLTQQPLGLADSLTSLDVRAPALATGAEIRMGRVVRYVDGSNYYHILLCWKTTSTVDLTIWSRIAGTDTELVRATGLGSYASGDWWRLLVEMRGSAINAMAWSTSLTKPQKWQLSTTDTSMTAAGGIGCRTFLAAGNTNTLPLTCEFDLNDVQVPQTFTVTRSVNTVVKSQTAGTAVGLWRPPVYAL